MAQTDKLVWIDCEMTGLDTVNDALVEVAAIVTDGELNVLGEGVSVVIKPSDEALAQMDSFVTNMHTESGLITELADGLEMAEAEKIVLAYVNEHTAGQKPPLAGNTVGMDKIFLHRDMPTLMEALHYRVVDVSSIKELARRWYPRAYFNSPQKTGNHRALGDIQDSILELKYYREVVFVEGEGPSGDDAKAAAAMVSEANPDLV